MKREVISLHFLDECNLHCPFCYRSSHSHDYLDYNFWIECVPYFSKVTRQIALGGGEPFYSRSSSKFVLRFSSECKKYGLICNCTTNGKNVEFIINYGKNLDLISVSYDTYKWDRIDSYLSVLKEIKSHLRRVGCNFLITQEYLDEHKFIRDVKRILEVADYIYFLMPKKTFFVDVLKIRSLIYGFAFLYAGRVLVDNCLYLILKEKRYSNWSVPCHFGKEILNVNPDGTVTGCSFDESILCKIKDPRDVLELRNIRTEKRYSCPYLEVRS